MKRIVLILIYCLLILASFGQDKTDNSINHHCLFNERSLTLGVSSPYSFHLKAPGANFRMYYNVNESFCFGPEYSYHKTGKAEVIDFDFVAHYIFETPWLGLYPVAGLNYTLETSFEHLSKNAKPGVVLGAGCHRNFNHVTFFAEYSRVEIGIVDQWLTAGIMYTFK